MKRIFFIFCLAVCVCPAAAQNKIQMVTYFPVPYVAYSHINPQNQLDIGLTSACEMSLGCTESGVLGHRPLQAGTVNLNTGGLDFNGAAAVKSATVTLGSGAGDANIDFKTNLRVNELKNGYTLQADTIMEVDELRLFASHMSSAAAAKFPDCQATGAPGAPQVSWQKVQLKDKENVYLVCGTPKDVAKCQPTHNGQETYTENCPLNQTGNIRYTWDYTSCKYLTLNSCRSTKKKCLTKALYCGSMDVSTGAANDGGCATDGGLNQCQSIRNGQGFFLGYFGDVTLMEQLRSSGYETSLPFNCTLGSECSSCTAGKKYFISNTLKGKSCYDSNYMYGPGSCRTLYIFQYAMCGEMDDCSAGTTPACSTWKDAGGTSNPLPLIPDREPVIIR